MRLVPDANDPYRWKYSKRVQNLFTTNISNQSISMYKALYREIEVKKSVTASPQHESEEDDG